MTDEDLKKIGDEFIRVLTPFSDSLDRVETRIEKLDHRMDKLEGRMEEVEDKFGALIVDVYHIQQKSDAMYDRMISVEEKVTQHNKDERDNLNEIRIHVGMLPLK